MIWDGDTSKMLSLPSNKDQNLLSLTRGTDELCQVLCDGFLETCGVLVDACSITWVLTKFLPPVLKDRIADGLDE